jgi:DNA mismatch repair protein MutL
VPAEEKTSLAQLKGFVLKPEFSKKTRGNQFFFVNNRFIKSSFLHHAVANAFEGLLKPGYHPGYFLYLTVDPKTIDINIHPTKTEIKFEEEQSIYAILRSAVKHSLGIFQVIPTLDFEQNPSFEVPYSFKEKNPIPPPIEVDSSFNPFQTNSEFNSTKVKPEQWETILSGIQIDPSDESSQESSLLDVPQRTRVFQLFLKYIVCPLQSSMILIDQNRAHQRVLYERFLTAITAKKGVSQQLLFPLEMKLNAMQLEEFKLSGEVLESLGFELALKPGGILEVLGGPEHCPQSKIEAVLETLFSGSEDRSIAHFSQADQIAKSMAKSLAIKSGDLLAIEEQQTLLDDFFGCKETSVSPFNKPIFITLDKREIEQKLN